MKDKKNELKKLDYTININYIYRLWKIPLVCPYFLNKNCTNFKNYFSKFNLKIVSEII